MGLKEYLSHLHTPVLYEKKKVMNDCNQYSICGKTRGVSAMYFWLILTIFSGGSMTTKGFERHQRGSTPLTNRALTVINFQNLKTQLFLCVADCQFLTEMPNLASRIQNQKSIIDLFPINRMENFYEWIWLMFRFQISTNATFQLRRAQASPNVWTHMVAFFAWKWTLVATRMVRSFPSTKLHLF